jgi:hypothetical protein
MDDHVSTAGDHTGDAEAAAFATTVTSWVFLNGLDVRASTTMGLPGRAAAAPAAAPPGVGPEQGSSGNRILHDSPFGQPLDPDQWRGRPQSGRGPSRLLRPGQAAAAALQHPPRT